MQAKKILHLINRYLPPSQVWLYNLLIHTKGVQHHIGSREFLTHNFYPSRFTFTQSAIGAYHQHLMRSDKGVFRSRLDHLLLWPQKWVYPTEEKQWTAYIKEEGIQLIHAHFANCGCKHMNWVKKTGLPFIISFYGYDYEKLPFTNKRIRKQYKSLFEGADYILCEGPHGIETLIKMGCPSSKPRLIPLGIDMEQWRTKPRKTKKRGSLKLLQIADFTEKKGQLDTIKAAIEARQDATNLQLTLVGSARNEAYFNKCMQLIQQDENRSWIKYIPFVAYQELKELMTEYDVFIHPSKYAADKDCEGGAPTILFNAQAMGMPVIATRHCDIPFVVKQKITGLLSQEGELEALKRAILYFYERTEDEFTFWQKNTFDWSEKSGDIQKSANDLLGVYDRAIR